jgi:hypothetical protein
LPQPHDEQRLVVRRGPIAGDVAIDHRDELHAGKSVAIHLVPEHVVVVPVRVDRPTRHRVAAASTNLATLAVRREEFAVTAIYGRI